MSEESTEVFVDVEGAIRVVLESSVAQFSNSTQAEHGRWGAGIENHVVEVAMSVGKDDVVEFAARAFFHKHSFQIHEREVRRLRRYLWVQVS